MRVVAAWLVGMLVAAVNAQTAPPLFLIPTEAPKGVTLTAQSPLHVMLTASDAPMLGALLGVKVPAGASSFEYIVDRYPQLESKNPRTWLEPTFLIDFDEPPFAALRAEMKDLGDKPDREALVEFVNRTIHENYERGWDLASTVAKRREGDCTEHAVLTTALARMYGIPSRVVIGAALVSDGEHHNAFGHAWSEVREQDRWVVADAALLGEKGDVRYLPMGVIEDEGLGYGMGIAALQRTWIQRVEVLAPGELAIAKP
ncbi:MAG TPA: transglutaminase-like domain-containing protein [Steroidobacteraceae bacterium]|nr:transglutaminase-like domain-containing protein [Steroidobacteraceae bacterium]